MMCCPAFERLPSERPYTTYRQVEKACPDTAAGAPRQSVFACMRLSETGSQLPGLGRGSLDESPAAARWLPRRSADTNKTGVCKGAAEQLREAHIGHLGIPLLDEDIGRLDVLQEAGPTHAAASSEDHLRGQ